MKILAHRKPTGPIDLSIVLLDWSCRESFHLLDHLADQTVGRESYEVIWVEFYDLSADGVATRMAEAGKAGRHPPVDIWAVMQMPAEVCYHKHLMYNAGIALSSGRVVAICDSDAMVRPTFVESIVGRFAHDADIVLHLDEVRNDHTSFYPFCYPAFEDVSGFGAGNWVNGRPAGLLDRTDPLHSRNYGACFAARRDHLIDIGGADMHFDYLGHIAGPYEMTWRLVNAGKREVWHDREWLYHVWHPGQGGDLNYAGPHDGMHISTRALEARATGRTEPFVPGAGIKRLRKGTGPDDSEAAVEALIDPRWVNDWRMDGLETVGRKYKLARRAIRLSEHGPPAAGPAATPQPLFGRRPPGRWARLRYLPLIAGMVWRQLGVKRGAAALRTGPHGRTGGQWRRKLRALWAFLKRIGEYDRYCFRQCWLALAYAAQEEKDRLVLYGQGEAARILCALSAYLPITITHICPVQPEGTKRMFGREIISPEELAKTDATVLVATFVDVQAYLGRLEELGIGRDRIITLQ